MLVEILVIEGCPNEEPAVKLVAAADHVDHTRGDDDQRQTSDKSPMLLLVR